MKGAEIETSGAVRVEVAGPEDLAGALELLAGNGLPAEGFREHFGNAVVARAGGQVVGVATVEAYEDGALLRSLAVAEAFRGRGLGERMVEAMLDRAARLGLPRVYLLTETAAGFFPRFGFRPASREEVPPGVRRSAEFTGACPASALVMVRDAEEWKSGREDERKRG